MSGLLEESETTAAATPEPRTESEAPAPVVRGAVGALGPARTAAEFRKDRFLGKGTYGSVWKVTRIASGRIYALKEVDMRGKKQSEREESVNEIRLLASVRHPNIIRYRDSFFDNDHLFIITDFADKGDLSVVISACKKAGTTLPEDRIWSIFIQLSLGLAHMHRHSILHRDLKSSNVFLKGTPEVVKIGDLGVAKLLKASSTQTQVGTPFYISPEIWRKMPYNAKSDVWSLGCVLYEMATLHHPFQATSPKELSQKILRGRYAPIHGYSHDLRSIVEKLLCVETSSRPSMDALLAEPAVLRRMDLVPTHCRPTAAAAAAAAAQSQSLVSPTRPLSGAAAAISDEVLGTIKVPRNLTRLTSALPPPAYSDVMTPPSMQRDLSSIGANVPLISKLTLDLDDERPNAPPSLPPPPLPPSSLEPLPLLPLPCPAPTSTTTTTMAAAMQERQQLSPASAQRERDRHNLAVQRVIAHAQRSRRRSSMFVLPEALGSRDKNLALALHALPPQHDVSPPAPSAAPVVVARQRAAPVVAVAPRVSPPVIPPKLPSSSSRRPSIAPPPPKQDTTKAPAPTRSSARLSMLRDLSNASSSALPSAQPKQQQSSVPAPAPVVRARSRPSLAPKPTAKATAEVCPASKPASPLKTHKAGELPHYLLPRQSDRRTSISVPPPLPPTTRSSSSARRQSVAMWRP